MAAETERQLEFTALMNFFYHERTERIFTMWVDGAAISQVLMLGFAGWASLNQNHSFLPTLLIIATVCVTAIPLGGRFSDRKATHSALKQRWNALLGDIKRNGEDDSESLHKRCYDLHEAEPAPNNKRLLWAYHAACRAMGLEPAGEHKP